MPIVLDHRPFLRDVHALIDKVEEGGTTDGFVERVDMLVDLHNIPLRKNDYSRTMSMVVRLGNYEKARSFANCIGPYGLSRTGERVFRVVGRLFALATFIALVWACVWLYHQIV